MDLGNIRPLIPLHDRPPQHVKYRRILDPLFAPKKMALLEDEVVGAGQRAHRRVRCQGLVRPARPSSPCPCRARCSSAHGAPHRGPRPLPVDQGRHHPSRRRAPWRSSRRPQGGRGDKVYEYFDARCRAATPRQPTDDLLARSSPAGRRGAAHRRGGHRHLLPVPHRRARHRDGLPRLLLRLPRPGARAPSPAGGGRDRPSRPPSRSCCGGRARCRPCPAWSTEDVEFGGCPVAKGEQVMLRAQLGQHRRHRPPRGGRRRPAPQPQSASRLRRRRAPLSRVAPGPHGAARGAARVPPAHPRLLARARHGARVHRRACARCITLPLVFEPAG